MAWRRRYLVIFVSAWLLGLSWALSSPVGSSPDDNYHLTSILCQTDNEELCRDIDGEGPGVAVEVPAGYLAGDCYAFNSAASGGCVEDVTMSTRVNDHYNYRGDYPPTYYGALSIVAGSDVSVSVILMRISALTVALLTMALALWAAPDLRDSQIVAWSVGSIPLGMFLLASTNPSGWGLAGLAAMWPAGYALLHADAGRRTAVAVLATCSAAVLASSRGDTAGIAAGLLGLIVLVYARSTKQLVAAGLALLVAAGLAVAFVSSGQSGSLEEGLAGSSSASGLPLLWNNLLMLPELWAGVLGAKWGLGWLDTGMPGVVWVPTVAVVGALLLMGLVRIRVRRGLLLAAMASVTFAYPLLILQQSNAVVGEQFQPRYVLPALLVLFGLALSPLDGNGLRLSITQRVLVAVALTVASSLALHAELRRYVTGTDVSSFDLNDGAEWSYGGLGPMGVWVLGTLSAVILFAFVVRLTAPAGGQADKPTLGDVPGLRVSASGRVH